LGQTPVFLALNWSSNEIFRILLENVGNPNVQIDHDSMYNTALIIAVGNRNIIDIGLLIDAGDNPAHKNANA
jgi:ankyrin repeat protein